MRGNWDQQGSLVVAAEQQQHQQEQQTIVDAEHLRTEHPLHSSTTPAWGSIADRIPVKEELKDANNDSGISPGHYTSDSASTPNSSALNFSLSPKSPSIFVSKSLQLNSYEFSPKRHHKSCDSPLDYARVQQHNDEISQQSLLTQQLLSKDASSSTGARSANEGPVSSKTSPDPLECPICNFGTHNRLQFTDHLATHCSTSIKSDSSEFMKSVMEQLTNGGSGSSEELSRASPIKNERDSESEETDEPGLRVPRVNSQGKVKTFRCKQCNFIAITKLDFWEHSRCHIKVEKLLTCPKCPFVTEYKHHLEYHLRNHFGSKPYKCDKCNYSCVNKSMLNSHLKSHSNVYQFRCADCAYATKYCHSLKLHLRKYEHKPAMVLNADGSPNPLPIIDVYGTRRGPKIKFKKEDDQYCMEQKEVQQHKLLVPCNGFSDEFMSQQVSILNSQFQFSSANGIDDNSTNKANTNLDGNFSTPPTLIGFSYNQLFGGFNIPTNFNTNVGKDEFVEKSLERLKDNCMEVKSSVCKEFSSDASIDLSKHDTETLCKFITLPLELTNMNSDVNVKEEPEVDLKFMPLDLSMPESTMKDNLRISKANTNDISRSSGDKINDSSVVLEVNANSDLRTPNSNVNNSSRMLEVDVVTTTTKVTMVVPSKPPRTGGTSRRKGRAVKLDRRVIEQDSDEEMQEELPQVNRFDSISPAILPVPSESKELNNAIPMTHYNELTMNSEFFCEYCDITFGNEVMHSVHMGYHGYNNPYTCNMCGIHCTDKVSFFLHVGRSKH